MESNVSCSNRSQSILSVEDDQSVSSDVDPSDSVVMNDTDYDSSTSDFVPPPENVTHSVNKGQHKRSYLDVTDAFSHPTSR